MGSIVTENTQKKPRLLRGIVTSDAMNKSRVLTITRIVQHPVFGKTMKRTTKVMFHDETNTSKRGDVVLVTPTRPLSARKCFKLHSVVASGTIRD